MAQTPPSSTAIRVADLSQTAENGFELRPDSAALQALADELGLSALRKLSFAGRIKPIGRADWQLDARLGATVVQPCVVTLEPVTTRIDTDVTRQFLKDWQDPEEAEVEMTQDETAEPLGIWIDPAQVMQEALILAVPDYPRKDAASLGQMVYAEPGVTPMTDEDARPFAGLADLKSKLEGGQH